MEMVLAEQMGYSISFALIRLGALATAML